MIEKQSIDELQSDDEYGQGPLYTGTVYILRGAPGCGKSLIAQQLARAAYYDDKCADICCADDYFTDASGNYKWIADKVGAAHADCRAKFKEAIDNQVDVIIVANTNTTHKKYKYYEDLAIKANYFVQILLVGELTDKAVDTYVKINTHGVPREQIIKMRDRLLKSLNGT